MSNILEEMQVEALKSDAVDSMDEARDQLKTLIRMEWIGIIAIGGIVTPSPFVGSWIVPLAPFFAPTALRPPMTAAAKKLPPDVKKHLMFAIWGKCAKDGDILVLFMILAFCAWGIGLKGVGGGIVGMIFLFMLLRSFMKILAYRKTAKHIVIQQRNLVN
ncbi:MAG: hypothetical protein M0Z50_09830 [Planctomycetia bacterium]|jgi:hypothetical protein|nr:hypothetical protein [Planctomycetia bacterium]